MNGDKKVQFGSTGDYIYLTSSNLTMVAAADMITTAGDEFKVDAVTDITLDADGEDIFFKDLKTETLYFSVLTSLSFFLFLNFLLFFPDIFFINYFFFPSFLKTN